MKNCLGSKIIFLSRQKKLNSLIESLLLIQVLLAIFTYK